MEDKRIKNVSEYVEEICEVQKNIYTSILYNMKFRFSGDNQMLIFRFFLRLRVIGEMQLTFRS